MPGTNGRADEDECEDAEPELPFVDAAPEYEHARAVPVAVKTDHRGVNSRREKAAKALRPR